MNYRKLWSSLFVVIVASFAVLIYYGNDIYHKDDWCKQSQTESQ
jgi:nitric oxide reductase large subunit